MEKAVVKCSLFLLHRLSTGWVGCLPCYSSYSISTNLVYIQAALAEVKKFYGFIRKMHPTWKNRL
jgi:hypothetical protein